MIQTPLIKWLHAKWREIEEREERRLQQNEFAEMLGFSKNFMSMVFSGKRKLGLESVIQVWKATGDASIFDVTGYSEHKPREVSASEFVNSMSPEDRSKLVEAAARIKSMALEQGVEINSPAGEALINEILRSVGL